MDQDITVKGQTSIISDGEKQDILEFYGVPKALDIIVDKERSSFLNKLECSAVIADEIRKMSGDGRFIVEIPEKLREAIGKGDAAFIKSVKKAGSYSPNIRVKGEKGIGGQITIKEVSPQAVSETLSNLAMLAMVQSVLDKMDLIESGIETILEGQLNDRIGKIIGAFKSFTDYYPSLEGKEAVSAVAYPTYLQMQEALAQIHLQIENERKELLKAPKNDWQVIVMTLRHPTSDKVGYYQTLYKKYVYHLQLYMRLLLLSDVVLFLSGKTEIIQRNHQVIESYCAQHLNGQFQRAMDYLTRHKTEAIESVRKLSALLPGIQDSSLDKAIAIECNLKQLEILEQHESESSTGSN